MKISILGGATISILAGRCVTQLAGLPGCAQNCVAPYATGAQFAGCNSLDVACICSNEGFLKSVACCLAEGCNTADQQTTVDYAQSVCKTAGVTVPDEVVCASSSASTSSAVSPSSPPSSSSSVSSTSSSSEFGSSNTSPVSSTSTSPSLTRSSSFTPLISSAPPSSTPSATISPSNSNSTTSSNSGLSTSAKLGIEIGVASGVILIVVVISIVVWESRKSGRGSNFWRRPRSGLGLPKGGSNAPAATEYTTPEMETNANFHEISSKPDSNPVMHLLPLELSSNPQFWNSLGAGQEAYVVGNLPQDQQHFQSVMEYPTEADSLAIYEAGPPQAHELDAFKAVRNENVPQGAYQVQRAVLPEPEVPSSSRPIMMYEIPNSTSGLESQINPHKFQLVQTSRSPKTIPRKSLPRSSPSSPKTAALPLNTASAVTPSTPSAPPAPPAPPVSSAASATSAQAESSENGEFSKLDFLQAQIDKVRKEKERLARLQELESLEAELQQKIENEHKKELTSSGF